MDVLLRWRWHRYVLAADVEKMFRQIWVYPDDRNLQRILWREGRDEVIRDYTLNTVTYGLACVPFLAMRTLRQLVQDEGCRYPEGAAVLRRDVYIDDVLTGADSRGRDPANKGAAIRIVQGGWLLAKEVDGE